MVRVEARTVSKAVYAACAWQRFGLTLLPNFQGYSTNAIKDKSAGGCWMMHVRMH
jgi:hypothetical protein